MSWMFAAAAMVAAVGACAEAVGEGSVPQERKPNYAAYMAVLIVMTGAATVLRLFGY